MIFLKNKNACMNNDPTALHIAPYKVHLNECQLIVETIGNKHSKSANDNTPLELACHFNQLHVVEYLSKGTFSNCIIYLNPSIYGYLLVIIGLILPLSNLQLLYFC